MTLDFHFHLGSGRRARNSGRPPAGCAIAQAPADNARYLQFSRRWGVACALFTHPRSGDYEEVIGAVASGRALSYQHLERLTAAELDELAPVLRACEAADMPVVVHLSWHDARRFPEAQAAGLLSRMVESYPALRIVVSHCGGENMRAAAEAARHCPRIFLDTSRLEETSLRCGLALSDVAERVPLSQLVHGSDAAWPGTRARPARRTLGPQVQRICERNATSLLRSFSPAI